MTWTHPLRSRPIDRLLAALGLIVTAPVLVAAALGIRMCDPGPVFYCTSRVGFRGEPFTMYKLRTMRLRRPEEGAARITGGTDARVFAWGRLLRRFKVDELPQLVNVIRGDMAIVGPRPEDPLIVEHDYVPWMRETLEVLPGLTSPGSLDYYADESGMPDNPVEAESVYRRELLPKKVAADLVYVRSRSVAYDARLVLRTIVSVLGGHGLFAGTQARERQLALQILNQVAPR